MDKNIKILNLKLEHLLNSFSHLIPEIFLAGLFILLILLDLLLKKRYVYILPSVTLLGLLLILYLSMLQFQKPLEGGLFIGEMDLDDFAVFFKILMLISAIITIVYSFIQSAQGNSELYKGEFYMILISLVLGLHLMVMASDFLMMYLSVELVSISSYILSAFGFNKRSSEASMKYLLFGALSSGIMLYGMSFLYGFTGTLNFDSFQFLSALTESLIILVPLFMVIGGLLFKISAFPFHIWTPDVYEGAPTPIVAFFSIAPKAAGLAILIRFISIYTHGSTPFFYLYLDYILIIIAMLSLTMGNLSALLQNNAKRMLAYSSIAHMGFMLIGLSAFSKLGLKSILFYLPVYLFMNFAAFLMVDILTNKTGSEDVRNYKGLGIKLPLLGVIFVITMIALTGLPPTAGFHAKLFVFSAIWEAYKNTGKELLFYLFIFGLFNTVISLYYYLRIPFYMYFRKPENTVAISIGFSLNLLLVLIAIPLLILFFYPDLLMKYINNIKTTF